MAMWGFGIADGGLMALSQCRSKMFLLPSPMTFGIPSATHESLGSLGSSDWQGVIMSPGDCVSLRPLTVSSKDLVLLLWGS